MPSTADEGIHEARGVITLAQEDRFRLQATDGRSLLLTLDAQRAPVSIEDLEALAGSLQRVWVRYRGNPEAGAVALAIRRG